MGWLPLVAVAVGVASGAFAIAVRVLGWRWTGLTGKTLWDWLQLLVIPLALVGVGFVLSSLQSAREQHREEQRAERGQRREARQAARDREIAADDRREQALRGYLQEMSDLMLQGSLLRARGSSEARLVARTLTLTVLRRLDVRRKAAVARFLAESHLLNEGFGRRPRLDLGGADFRGVQLGDATFGEVPGDGVIGAEALASFRGADFRDASFRGATVVSTRFENARLAGADFTGATLVEADFRGADLTGASFHRARTRLLETTFEYADLQDADLRETELLASFDGASLEHADLSDANLLAAWGEAPRRLRRSLSHRRPIRRRVGPARRFHARLRRRPRLHRRRPARRGLRQRAAPRRPLPGSQDRARAAARDRTRGPPRF